MKADLETPHLWQEPGGIWIVSRGDRHTAYPGYSQAEILRIEKERKD